MRPRLALSPPSSLRVVLFSVAEAVASGHRKEPTDSFRQCRAIEPVQLFGGKVPICDMRQASVFTSLDGTYLHRLSNVCLHLCPCRDLGQTEFSENTVMHVLADPKQQFTIIAGDLSYADGDQPRWDRWGNLFEPLISTRVFQPAVMITSTFP